MITWLPLTNQQMTLCKKNFINWWWTQWSFEPIQLLWLCKFYWVPVYNFNGTYKFIEELTDRIGIASTSVGFPLYIFPTHLSRWDHVSPCHHRKSHHNEMLQQLISFWWRESSFGVLKISIIVYSLDRTKCSSCNSLETEKRPNKPTNDEKSASLIQLKQVLICIKDFDMLLEEIKKAKKRMNQLIYWMNWNSDKSRFSW